MNFQHLIVIYNIKLDSTDHSIKYINYN